MRGRSVPPPLRCGGVRQARIPLHAWREERSRMAIEYHFDAPADKVFARLTDADYLVDRCLELGELSAECTIEDDNAEVVITMRREVERHLPAVLAKLFDAQHTIELVERWSEKGNLRQGSYLMTIVDQPVTVEAEMRLKPDPNGGCTYAITHSVKANIPLIGRRIESFISAQTETGAKAELEHLAKHL
jgi:hypothetical protein